MPQILTIMQELWEEEILLSRPFKCMLRPEARTDFPLEVLRSCSVAPLHVSANQN